MYILVRVDASLFSVSDNLMISKNTNACMCAHALAHQTQYTLTAGKKRSCKRAEKKERASE